ncbi:cation:proton antiporter domain-containing protein, partial [Staphylococcus epidermidis]|uniref:cation:proton antiporter domain-containing protein n=1 Tax=Staphylococcus epidermidis TaxID=1282 RepID=UPI001642E34C
LQIHFNPFKKHSRPTQAQDKHENHLPPHLKLALTLFPFIIIISLLLPFPFKSLRLLNHLLLILIIISTISLPLLVPTLKQINIIPTTIRQFILLLALLPDLFTM